MPSRRFLFADCDSTLSSIEGIDELAQLKGPGLFARIAALTTDAMEGRITIASVFARRLDLIQPTRADAETVARHYVETLEPHVAEAFAGIRALGWEIIILSGGFRNAIRPLAAGLGVERVEAVDLYFDDKGNYAGHDTAYPTTRNGGKPEVIAAVLAANPGSRAVMIGDGMSDAEAKAPGAASAFIAYTRVARREKAVARADAHTADWREVPALLERL